VSVVRGLKKSRNQHRAFLGSKRIRPASRSFQRTVENYVNKGGQNKRNSIGWGGAVARAQMGTCGGEGGGG